MKGLGNNIVRAGGDITFCIEVKNSDGKAIRAIPSDFPKPLVYPITSVVTDVILSTDNCAGSGEKVGRFMEFTVTAPSVPNSVVTVVGRVSILSGNTIRGRSDR